MLHVVFVWRYALRQLLVWCQLAHGEPGLQGEIQLIMQYVQHSQTWIPH